MNQVIERIYEHLKAANIQIVNSNIKDEQQSESLYITIPVKDSDHAKWIYFSNRLNQKEEITKIEHLESQFKFIFCNYKDNETFIQHLEKFYECLEKKYYKVSPKVKKFSILVKPTHRCNLDCKYCYDKPYRDNIKEDMSMDTLDRLLRILSEYSEDVQLIWHGGEPTMVGVEWYEKAYTQVFSKYPMTNWNFYIMSNGTKYDDEWMKLFKKYKINPGLSYNAKFQDILRCSSQLKENTSKDKEKSERIEKIIAQGREYNFEIGIIDVITNKNYKHMIDLYEYYKSLGGNVSFNTVFHTKQTEKNKLDISVEDFVGEYLKYFRYWLFDKDGIAERSAQEILQILAGDGRVTCTYTDCRREWIGINPIGEIYPCDRYYPDKYKIGTIFEFNRIDEIFDSRQYSNYCDEIQKRFDGVCKECGYWFACHGGCNACAYESTGSVEGIDEFFCETFRLKFNGVYEILRDIDIVYDTNLNPVARDILINNNFYSVKDIKLFLTQIGKEFVMDYNPKDLINCSEYQIFRGINFAKDSPNHINRHLDFIMARDSESMKKNEENRNRDLLEYMKRIISSTLDSKSICISQEKCRTFSKRFKEINKN